MNNPQLSRKEKKIKIKAYKLGVKQGLNTLRRKVIENPDKPLGDIINEIMLLSKQRKLI
jgi:hypothetical protein